MAAAISLKWCVAASSKWLAAQAGQLDLNVFAPVMVHNILSSLGLLTNFLPVFTERCVAGITADVERCRARCSEQSRGVSPEPVPLDARVGTGGVGFREAGKP